MTLGLNVLLDSRVQMIKGLRLGVYRGDRYPTYWVFSEADTTPININKADRASLITVFKGTGIKQTTIDKLVKSRQDQLYRNLDDLVSSGLISTQAVRKKLQEKLDNGNICFEQQG